MKVDIGTRMKEYENVYNQKLTRRLPVIIRLDGKTFHTMTKRWKCKKPYDDFLLRLMKYTTRQLCEHISGCELAYSQSDEISLLLRNDRELNTSPWFDNKVQKIVSVSSSIATMAFNCDLVNGGIDVSLKNMAMFDSRVFVVPYSDVTNYFIWRQKDATRNSIQMLAQSLYDHQELHGKNNDQLQEMCFELGHNWNDVPTVNKRGFCFIKEKQIMTDCDGRDFERNKWVEDNEIPVFTKNREYIEKWLQ